MLKGCDVSLLSVILADHSVKKDRTQEVIRGGQPCSRRRWSSRPGRTPSKAPRISNVIIPATFFWRYISSISV
jgi:hypothetical protein